MTSACYVAILLMGKIVPKEWTSPTRCNPNKPLQQRRPSQGSDPRVVVSDIGRGRNLRFDSHSVAAPAAL